MQTRKCQCGCGAEVFGINSNTGKPILYRPGHSGRGKPRMTTRQAAQRASWPSRDEMAALLDEHGTTSAVARSLGRPYGTVKNMIVKLGVATVPHANSMPKSSMRFGWEGEDHAAMLLGGTVARQRDQADTPYDVICDGMRIEVKTAHPTLAGKPANLGWTFSIAHNAGKHDALFAICCADNGLPRAYFLIPAEETPASMLRIPMSLRSKWTRYRWTPTSG